MFLDKETFVAHGSFNTFYSEEWLCIQQLCTPALVNLFTLTQFREPSKKKMQCIGVQLFLPYRLHSASPFDSRYLSFLDLHCTLKFVHRPPMRAMLS